MLTLLQVFSVAVAATLLAVIRSVILPPQNFPKNIPTIPFYLALIPFFKQVDQAELYKRYLEKHLATYGAVKIYFGCRWNILVQRPQFIAEVFKREDIYAKSGNQVKIPYSVLAEYTGDNIISSHGENWRLYQSVIKPGLQRKFDAEAIRKNAHLLVDKLLMGQRDSVGGVVVPQLVQRCTLANLSEVVLGSNFKTLEVDDAPLHALQISVKREIFKPTFLSFPFLDLLPIPSRQRARQLTRQFTDILCSTVVESHQSETKAHGHMCLPSSNALGCRMIAAHESGTLTDHQFRHNMVSIFLAGHENPQLLLVSFMYLLAKDQSAQTKLREEILSHVGGDKEPSETTLNNMPYLTAVIYETLRMYPPISQLINRRTSQPIMLGGNIPIPQGTYIGYHAYSTNRNPESWGAEANEFRPERWGTTMDEIASNYRRANSRCDFISFHGGRRACLGERYALFSTRVMIVEIMRRLQWKLDSNWVERMTPAGPLYPMQLALRFETIPGTTMKEDDLI